MMMPERRDDLYWKVAEDVECPVCGLYGCEYIYKDLFSRDVIGCDICSPECEGRDDVLEVDAQDYYYEVVRDSEYYKDFYY